MSLILNTLKNFWQYTKHERQNVVEIMKHFSTSKYHQYPHAYTWNNMPNTETTFIAFIGFYFCPFPPCANKEATGMQRIIFKT
jgi:hypothetical protein